MNEGRPIDGLRDSPAPEKRKRGRPPLKSPAAAVIRPKIAAAEAETIRPPVRAAVRDSVREAEEYAAKLMNELGDSIDQFDEFYVDLNVIPDGWSYQWKRTTYVGKADQHHMLSVARNGWRPVDVSRHPEMMPAGHQGPIEIKGLMLMEMPTLIVERARRRDEREARDALLNSERLLHETPANTAPRDEFPDKMKFVKREIMRAVDEPKISGDPRG